MPSKRCGFELMLSSPCPLGMIWQNAHMVLRSTTTHRDQCPEYLDTRSGLQQYRAVKRLLLTGVEAKVVEGLAEVGHVRLALAAAQPAHEQVPRELGLLRKRQHQGPEYREVALERRGGHLDDVLVQLDADFAFAVLRLVHAAAWKLACQMYKVSILCCSCRTWEAGQDGG